MPVACCLRPLIVLHVELFPEIDKLLCDVFDELDWRNAFLRSRLLNFLTMLINTGKEKNFFAFEPLITGDHISQHFFVSMADMRRRVCVVNRRRDEKGLWHTVKLPDESL